MELNLNTKTMIETDKGQDNPDLKNMNGCTKAIAFGMLVIIFGGLYWLFMSI